MAASAEVLGWVVCGNISDHLRGGTDPDRFYQGTRMFSPGTKVYLGPAYWGMGGRCVHAVGLRRISRDFVNCVIDTGVLENLRPGSVYSASRWATLTKLGAMTFETRSEAEQEVERYSDALKREGPDKLLPVERSGPWGPYLVDAYRMG